MGGRRGPAPISPPGFRPSAAYTSARVPGHGPCPHVNPHHFRRDLPGPVSQHGLSHWAAGLGPCRNVPNLGRGRGSPLSGLGSWTPGPGCHAPSEWGRATGPPHPKCSGTHRPLESRHSPQWPLHPPGLRVCPAWATYDIISSGACHSGPVFVLHQSVPVTPGPGRTLPPCGSPSSCGGHTHLATGWGRVPGLTGTCTPFSHSWRQGSAST